MRYRSTGRVVAVAATTVVAAVGGALAPSGAVAQKKAKPASMTLAAPTAGDVSYAVIQVRRTSTKPGRSRAGRDRAFGGTVGGLGIDVRSPAWKRLKKTTKVYVASAPIQGNANRSLRNVIVFVTRKKAKGGPASGTFTVRFRNATANRSFWVRSVKANGRAEVFAVRNILSTALGNWGQYLKVLASKRALRAAHDPVDVTGRFSQNPPQAVGTISVGGAKMTPRVRQVYRLIFGTLGEPLSYQAAKKSPLAADFIEKELGNKALATKWRDVANRLPLQVPDTYAAAAKTEAKFVKVNAPRISFRQVQIRDRGNSTEQAAIEVPRLSTDQLPGTRLTVQVTGSGKGSVKDDKGLIACPPVCTGFYTSGLRVDLDAQPESGSEFAGFDGCTGRVKGKGSSCDIGLVTDKAGPSLIVTANFRVDPPSTPTGDPNIGALAPATLDPTFGFGGVESLPFSQSGTARSAFANRIAVGPDGKLLLVGVREGAGVADNDWATARYSADGVLDTSGYSTNGTVVLNETGVNLGGRDAAVDATGNSYVTGETTSGDLKVVAIAPNGLGFTAGFGSGGLGLASIPVPGATRVSGQAITLLPDGKILVVGDADIGGFVHVVAARFLANGTPDLAFDDGSDGTDDGVVVSGACDAVGGGGGCTVNDVAIRTSGSFTTGIYIGGYTMAPVFTDYAGFVLRMAPTGGLTDDVTLDPAYGDPGTPGIRRFDPAAVGSVSSIVLESDGSVVASGRTAPPAMGPPQCAVAKLTPTGDLDAGFGSSGVTRLELTHGCEASGLARRAAGGYVIAGSDYALDSHAVLGRLTADGAADLAFATQGVKTVPSAGEPGFFTDVVVRGDKIVAAGGAFPFPHRFQIARYTGG